MNEQLETNMPQNTDTTSVPAPGRDVEWRDLTLKQQRVLEWLAKFLLGKEMTITRIYSRIGIALGMSQRAARVHVNALKQKGLILTEVYYRPNFKQKIGIRISITPDDPIKHLPHKLSAAEMQEIKERGEKEARVRELLRQGYTYINEIDGYVLRESQNMRRW